MQSKEKVILSATKQSIILVYKNLNKFVKSQYDSIFSFKHYVLHVSWEGFFKFILFCNCAFFSRLERAFLAPYDVTSSCNVSVYLYLGMVYMYMCPVIFHHRYFSNV